MRGGRGVDDTEADGMSRELLTLIIIICCRIVVVWYMLRSHSHCPVCVFSHCLAYLVATMRTLRGNTTSISQKGIHDSVLKP